jgi:hypothetical protein
MATVEERGILCATAREERDVSTIGIVVTFAIVIAGLVFVIYGLIRPFTHTDHDHTQVFHPPHLDGR